MWYNDIGYDNKWFKDVEKIISDTYNDCEDEESIEEESLTIVDRNINGTNRRVDFNQSTRSVGVSAEDKAFSKRIKQARNRLTPVEKKVFDLILAGKSIAESARKLKISQQRAQQCWNHIKEKLQ